LRLVIGVPRRTRAAWGKIIIGVALCLGLGACSDDDSPGKTDIESTTDQMVVVDSQVTDGVAADSTVPTDGAPADAGAPGWTCTLDPGSGPFSTVHSDGCRWSWTCPTDGDHELFCETISTASHTCTCKNTTTGATEKTFTSTDICTVAETAIAARANAECGWNLP
jgi:hypothetical protein